MKQLAVEWLVGKILTKDEIYDYYGNVIGYKLINTYTSSEDFSKYVEEAKAMEKEQSHAEYMRGWKDGLTSSSGVTYRCCGLRLSIHGCGCPQETLKSE